MVLLAASASSPVLRTFDSIYLFILDMPTVRRRLLGMQTFNVVNESLRPICTNPHAALTEFIRIVFSAVTPGRRHAFSFGP